MRRTRTEMLFACPTCGRKVVVGKREPKFVVLDRGDVYALHSGSTGGLSLTARRRRLTTAPSNLEEARPCRGGPPHCQHLAEGAIRAGSPP